MKQNKNTRTNNEGAESSALNVVYGKPFILVHNARGKSKEEIDQAVYDAKIAYKARMAKLTWQDGLNNEKQYNLDDENKDSKNVESREEDLLNIIDEGQAKSMEIEEGHDQPTKNKENHGSVEKRLKSRDWPKVKGENHQLRVVIGKDGKTDKNREEGNKSGYLDKIDEVRVIDTKERCVPYKKNYSTEKDKILKYELEIRNMIVQEMKTIHTDLVAMLKSDTKYSPKQHKSFLTYKTLRHTEGEGGEEKDDKIASKNIGKLEKIKDEYLPMGKGHIKYYGVQVPYRIDLEPSKWRKFEGERNKVATEVTYETSKIENNPGNEIGEHWSEKVDDILQRHPLMYNVRLGEKDLSCKQIAKELTEGIKGGDNEAYWEGLKGVQNEKKLSNESYKAGVAARIVGIHSDSFRSNDAGAMNYNINQLRNACMNMGGQGLFYDERETGTLTSQQNSTSKQDQHKIAVELLSNGEGALSYQHNAIANNLKLYKLLKTITGISYDSDSEYEAEYETTNLKKEKLDNVTIKQLKKVQLESTSDMQEEETIEKIMTLAKTLNDSAKKRLIEMIQQTEVKQKEE